MSDKFEKRDRCLYCETPMESKYRNKRFCSDRCRTYWNRENKGKTTIVDLNEQSGKKEVVPPKTTNTTIDTKRPFMSEAIKKKLGL